MSKNICTLSKWFPSDILEQQNFFDGCKEMEITGSHLISRISLLSNFIKNNKAFKFNHSMIGENVMLLSEIEDVSSALENILKNYNAILPKVKMNVHSLLSNKLKIWRRILWDVKLKVCYCVQNLITNISPLFIQYGEQFLALTLRISMAFNSLLVLDTICSSDRSIMCNNTCSYLIFPLRKVSITRLLQFIACSRAELCCHILIDCLLETYRLYDISEDETGSDNSSLEIYMTLTKHMSPPEMPENVMKKDNSSNGRSNDFHKFSNLDDLITYEEKNVYDLLNLALKNTPSLLGCDAVKKSKITDHSVHMTRIWAVNESKKLSNIWNVQRFFCLINGDIVECLTQLNCLRMSVHSNEIQKGNLDVHVEVCALMRAKLVSEVKVNIQKLKDTQGKCIDGLASVCKTICLANLKMIFPPSSYWKQTGTELLPEKPSSFVNKYLDQILVPVLEATDDHVIANMILTLICESWLDHIYKNKILFSQYGACQLLCDFGYVTTWLINCPNLGETMRKRLIKNEVLRRCEGVGRLLLRCPGENIKMSDKNKRKMSNLETSETDKNELMPAEMYVPNQEQWLELRALKKKSLFLHPICCDKY